MEIKAKDTKQKIFHKASINFFSEHQDTLLLECTLFQKKKSATFQTKVWFMRIYDTFILISKVFVQNFFFFI